MQTKLIESSANTPLGKPYGRKLHEVVSGEYSGRLVALIQSSTTEIELTYADSPYTSWSNPQTMVSDAADKPFDCLMENNGDIHLVYSEDTTAYLVTRVLTFADGNWSAGSKVTIYSGSQCFEPSLALEPSGTLWVAYAGFTTPNRTTYIKSSTDGGSTWGSGSSDPGTQLAGPNVNLWAKTLVGPNDVFVIYTIDLQKIAMRSRPLTGGSWTAEFVIGTGSSLSDDFDAAVRADGLLAVVYDKIGLNYREYDGYSWAPEVQIESVAAESPNVFFHNNLPVIVYLDAFEGGQKLLKYTVRRSNAFSDPAVLDPRSRIFDSVVLFHSSSATYQDLTSEAGNSSTADLYHSNSGCLLKDSGDRAYLGMDVPFRYVHFLLSTAGVGGTVSYSYYDGSSWNAVTPVNGPSYLDSILERCVLWDDYAGIPQDWQKTEINSESRFWIRVQVDSSFTTGPVGSQVSAVSELHKLILRR